MQCNVRYTQFDASRNSVQALNIHDIHKFNVNIQVWSNFSVIIRNFDSQEKKKDFHTSR